MNGMRNDFYGHPPRRHIGPGVVLAAVLLASLAGTAWYAQTNYQALYEANKRAQQETGSLRP